MGKLKLKKPAAPILSRLQRAEGLFRIAYLEHAAWGQKMVLARTELLEANAQERAKLALQFPDDKLIQVKCNEATEELLAWYKKIGTVVPVHKESTMEEAFRINEEYWSSDK